MFRSNIADYQVGEYLQLKDRLLPLIVGFLHVTPASCCKKQGTRT